MQVKRFVAADMRRALELVRQELGPDAITDVRPYPPGNGVSPPPYGPPPPPPP